MAAREDLIELVAPGGCDEANHGTERYRVDNNGRIRVPREAAFWLIRSGGFRVASNDLSAAPVSTSAEFQPAIKAPQDGGNGAESADPRRVPRRK
jgi:hypothetical protein